MPVLSLPVTCYLADMSSAPPRLTSSLGASCTFLLTSMITFQLLLLLWRGTGSAVTVAILVDGWLLLLLRLLQRLAELKDVEAAEEDFPNRHSVTAAAVVVVVHGLPIISQLIRWRVGVEIWNAIRYSIYGRVRSNERTLWWTEIGCVIRESVRETRRTNEWADKRMDRRTDRQAVRQAGSVGLDPWAGGWSPHWTTIIIILILSYD